MAEPAKPAITYANLMQVPPHLIAETLAGGSDLLDRDARVHLLP